MICGESMLNETEIYLLIKKWLVNENWQVIGGEPPGGTNHIARIELHDPEYKLKGSKGSKKIDMVAYKNNFFLLLELKDDYSKISSDVKKLNTIVSEKKWINAFYKSVSERKIPILESLEIAIEDVIINKRNLIKAVGYNYNKKLGPDDYISFLIRNKSVIVQFGKKIPNKIRNLF